MKKLFKLLLILGFIFTITSCNVTNKMRDGDTPFSTVPTHIEFWNGGTCIGSYDNATVRVSSVHNSRLLGAPITWYYYEIYADGFCVDTIIDSEALAIKYKGRRVK